MDDDYGVLCGKFPREPQNLALPDALARLYPLLDIGVMGVEKEALRWLSRPMIQYDAKLRLRVGLFPNPLHNAVAESPNG
jgi:hypothetical protein